MPKGLVAEAIFIAARLNQHVQPFVRQQIGRQGTLGKILRGHHPTQIAETQGIGGEISKHGFLLVNV